MVALWPSWLLKETLTSRNLSKNTKTAYFYAVTQSRKNPSSANYIYPLDRSYFLMNEEKRQLCFYVSVKCLHWYLHMSVPWFLFWKLLSFCRCRNCCCRSWCRRCLVISLSASSLVFAQKFCRKKFFDSKFSSSQRFFLQKAFEWKMSFLVFFFFVFKRPLLLRHAEKQPLA